jgi:hypothetical protein
MPLNLQLGIITAEHREPDLQTKIDIYLGLPTRSIGSENNIFVRELVMKTETYLDSTIHSES